MASVKRKLVGLIGRAGAGKSTLANLLSERHGFAVVSLAAPLKAFVKPQDKSPSERERLIHTAQKLIEAFGQNLFVDTAVIGFLESGHFAGVIDDIRRPHEVERLAWWSVKEDIQVCLWHITVSEDELRRRRGDDYVPPDFPLERVDEAVASARSCGLLCGTIAKPVMELTPDELELVADWHRFCTTLPKP